MSIKYHLESTWKLYLIFGATIGVMVAVGVNNHRENTAAIGETEPQLVMRFGVPARRAELGGDQVALEWISTSPGYVSVTNGSGFGVGSSENHRKAFLVRGRCVKVDGFN